MKAQVNALNPFNWQHGGIEHVKARAFLFLSIIGLASNTNGKGNPMSPVYIKEAAGRAPAWVIKNPADQ